MRAAIVSEKGGSWQLADIPVPEPGFEQVLIRIAASGLCFTDIHITEGAIPANFPRILGHEPVGEIVSVGPGVSTRRIGDRVGVPYQQQSCGRCEWCRRGRVSYCAARKRTGVDVDGGHAEYMIAHAPSTVLLPDGLPYAQAASIFCAGYSVWSGLRLAQPKPGARIAVVGIGGLGHLAVQYSKAAGFETIAVTRSPDKLEIARALGADVVIRSGAELSALGGADVILATGNSYRFLAESLDGLRLDGKIVLIGVSDEPLPVKSDLIFKRGQIIGSGQNGLELLYEALELVCKGKVKVWTEIYKLDEINKAYERLSNGQVRFRAVIVN